MATSDGWTVLVPVKRLAAAKSRFTGLSPEERLELAVAFATDVAAAAAACPAVAEVVVVTDDPRIWESVTAVGAVPVSPETEGAGLGLNAELAGVAAGVTGPVAVVVGDLPCLSADDLGAVLAGAGAYARAFVGDAAGTGTTILTATADAPLAPHFGARSHAAHVRSGAVALSAPATARRDVDDEVDLWDAVRLGVGPATAACAVVRRLAAAS